MRKLVSVVGAMLLVGLSFAQPNPAAAQAGAAGVEKADKVRSEAIAKGDVATVDKTTADTYVYTDATGRVTTKQELLSAFKSGAIKIQSQDPTDVKVQIYGNTAVETGTISGQGTRDGKDISGTFRFTRVWVNHSGAWQTVAFQETKTQ